MQIAKLLKHCMQRCGDLVAGYSGKGVIILLPNTHQTRPIAIAQRIQDQLAAQAIYHAASPTDMHVIVSLGIAVVPIPTEMDDITAILIADEMLYAAKRRRNIYQLKVVSHSTG